MGLAGGVHEAGWKLPVSETGWLGGRRLGVAPESKTGAGDARDMPASETGLARWTLMTCGNRHVRGSM